MEIYTGIDIIENKRIEKAINRFGKKFLHRVFTEKEIEYCLSKADKIPCIAARFAAKEAFVKAYYNAFGESIPYKNIEITGATGKPATILLHTENIHSKHQENGLKFSLSISHEKNYSVAVVIIYQS